MGRGSRNEKAFMVAIGAKNDRHRPLQNDNPLCMFSKQTLDAWYVSEQDFWHYPQRGGSAQMKLITYMLGTILIMSFIYNADAQQNSPNMDQVKYFMYMADRDSPEIAAARKEDERRIECCMFKCISGAFINNYLEMIEHNMCSSIISSSGAGKSNEMCANIDDEAITDYFSLKKQYLTDEFKNIMHEKEVKLFGPKSEQARNAPKETTTPDVPKTPRIAKEKSNTISNKQLACYTLTSEYTSNKAMAVHALQNTQQGGVNQQNLSYETSMRNAQRAYARLINMGCKIPEY